MRDVKANFDIVTLFPKVAVTASQTVKGTEIADYHGQCVYVDVGEWTDGEFSIEVQDSDDGTNYTAVADQFLDGAEPVIDGAADDDQVYKIGYTGNKKFLGVVITEAEASTGCVLGVYVGKGYPSQQ